MPELDDIIRRAWKAAKLEHQPDFDGLVRDFVLQLESRAVEVTATGIASDGDEVLARFEREVKRIMEEPKPEFEMAMAAEIPEEIKEELVEEVKEEVKPKPRKKVALKPPLKKPIKVVKPAAKPVAKKK